MKTNKLRLQTAIFSSQFSLLSLSGTNFSEPLNIAGLDHGDRAVGKFNTQGSVRLKAVGSAVDTSVRQRYTDVLAAEIC